MNLLFLFSSHSRSISSILKSLKALVLIPSRFPLERPTRCLASTPHDREHHHEAPGGLATRFGGGTDEVWGGVGPKEAFDTSPAFSIFSSIIPTMLPRPDRGGFTATTARLPQAAPTRRPW